MNERDSNGECNNHNDDDELSNQYKSDDPKAAVTFELLDEDKDKDDVVEDGHDDDDGDGFNLLTQSNELFKRNTMNADDNYNSNTKSSDDNSSSSGSSAEYDDDDSDSDSSIEEVTDVATPLQQRRERNVTRNNAFIASIKSGLNEMMNGYQSNTEQHDCSLPNNKRKRKTNGSSKKIIEFSAATEYDTIDMDDTSNKKRRRGMLFSTPFNKRRISYSNSTTPTSSSSWQEWQHTTEFISTLKLKYPHRTQQIHILCSQLVTIVRKTKFAWQMTDNLRSYGNNNQFSEASYQGDVKLAASSPIMITGAGGSGKACIVRDALEVLQGVGTCCRRRRGTTSTNNNIAVAYVNCASSESGSVASVMHEAYRQLFDCFNPSCGFNDDGKVRLKESEKLFSGKEQSILTNEDFTEDDEIDIADEDSIEEELLEKQRNRKRQKVHNNRHGRKSTNDAKIAKQSRVHDNVRQTRLRSGAVSETTVNNTSSSLKGSIQNTNNNRRTQSSSVVALFGRGISSLIQGNPAKKKLPNNWRCAFLVLDNADRILSWNKHGCVSPLTQILMLPRIMGINFNLTLIFISRSTLFQYSPVYNSPGTLFDAIHPITIHFDSYTSVEKIQSILHVSHVKQSIIGLPSRSMSLCDRAMTLRLRMHDILYSSMMNSFVPSVISTTHDMIEIIRLARLLWPAYIEPVENCDDDTIEELMRQIVDCLNGDDSSAMSCKSILESSCNLCQYSTSTGLESTDLNLLKQQLSEKLDRNIRETMRGLLTSTIMMPGRVLPTKDGTPYVERLPYITKFLLLAAFLCQNKRKEQDTNLFTTENTGKSKRRRVNKTEDGTAYASSSKDLTQRQPLFPLERMLSVFASIIGQYGHSHYMSYKEVGVTTVAQLGTTHLFHNVSQLMTTGLLRKNGKATFDDKDEYDLLETMSAKFSCTLSRDDALVIASSVGFPLEKYCT